MSNIKLILGYDGSSYRGFQLQENAFTVQQVLEEAIQTVFKAPARVTSAGRTDTGVHAIGQVVNFHMPSCIPVHRIPFALNAVLPKDIVVYQAEIVPDAFHARYNAVSKLYTYTIDNAPHPRVLLRNVVYHVKYPLDLPAMVSSAGILVGTHDFSSFQARGSSVRNSVRSLTRLDVTASDNFITITAEADGFLYKMVRIIVGTLIEVGRGKRSRDLQPVLDARDRGGAGWTAPAHGLVLREVKYK